MRYFSQFLTISVFWLFQSAYAMSFFVDPLYWQINESIDWVLTNNLSTSNQNITYKTAGFSPKTGIRLGVASNKDIDTRLYFTRYINHTADSATGNLTSAFLGGKLDQINALDPSLDFFYQEGQFRFSIDYNIIDLDFGKYFKISKSVTLKPLIGLEAGWINQEIDSTFNNPISVTEDISNDFSGIGPKIGIEGQWIFLHQDNTQWGLIADAAMSYLWGHWKITDVLTDSTPRTLTINTDSRNMGALSLQGLLGISMTHQNFVAKLGYEMNDWFNQCQIMDDATGAHNNNLTLQGLTLDLVYTF